MRRRSSATTLENGGGGADDFDGLRVRGLTIVYGTEAGELPAVREVDLDLPAGTITGVVGESGSGKSTLALAMLNAVPSPGRITAGSVTMSGVGDITRLKGRALRQVRGGVLGYVFQASQNSLNPLKRVGAQLLDLARSHGVAQPRTILGEAKGLCERMGLDPDRVLSSYQHELSGGMRQRVGLARALTVDADIILMDEPFSSVDEQTRRKFQEELLDLLKHKKKTVIFVTHSIEEAVYLSDRIVLLSPRPGKVSQIIQPNIDRQGKNPDQIRRDKNYLDTVDQIWQILKQYV